MLQLILFALSVFAADDIVVPSNAGVAYFRDNAGTLFPAEVAYRTDGAGNIKSLNPAVGLMSDDIVVPYNTGKMFLNGADGKLYPASVIYTTDGAGSIIPVPTYSFAPPLVSVGGTVSIPEATDLVDGYLSNDDHSFFGKLPIETDKYYVDGDIGDDATAIVHVGGIKYPFKTIQAVLNYLGQPSGRIDALRHITINISAKAALSGALFSGIYVENLTVPTRFITMQCAGCKIDGNILKEYSSSRRFGASSSEFRPTLTLIGLVEARDSHPRIRTGFHVGGTQRTSILKRNLDSIQGDGVNHITVSVASGQFTYPIYVTANYPTESYIRIAVAGTTNYNGTYDITSKIDSTHFVATRISGTNAHTETEISGSFFESDSAGASGVTHDVSLINVYQQGNISCDDGTINGAAITAGSEIFFSNGSRFYTGISGSGINLFRLDQNLISGGVSVGTITSMNQNTITGTFQTGAFAYATDDIGWMNNRFNGATVFTVTSAAQTVRMDSVTYTSFLASGSSWVTNAPTIAFLDNAKAQGYTPTTSGDWATPVPTTVQSALDRIASKVKALNGGVAIP